MRFGLFIAKLLKRNINNATGMRKDDALQKAKLAFMESNGNESLLPYYWANLILAGNGEPVNLTKNDYGIWILTTVSILLATLFVIFFRRKKKLPLLARNGVPHTNKS